MSDFFSRKGAKSAKIFCENPVMEEYLLELVKVAIQKREQKLLGMNVFVTEEQEPTTLTIADLRKAVDFMDVSIRFQENLLHVSWTIGFNHGKHVCNLKNMT